MKPKGAPSVAEEAVAISIGPALSGGGHVATEPDKACSRCCKDPEHRIDSHIVSSMAAPALLNARPDKTLLNECRSAWGRMSQGPKRAGGLPQASSAGHWRITPHESVRQPVSNSDHVIGTRRTKRLQFQISFS
jgi:hypothetical protein